MVLRVNLDWGIALGGIGLFVDEYNRRGVLLSDLMMNTSSVLENGIREKLRIDERARNAWYKNT